MKHWIPSRLLLSHATPLALVFAGSVLAQDCSSPDLFEDNNTCLDAAEVASGTFFGLNVASQDPDFYTLLVADGATVDVELLFGHALGDVDLFLWASGASCGTAASGASGPYLEASLSDTDGESLVYTNVTGADQDVFIEVVLLVPASCNEYEMIIEYSQCACTPGIGTPYCTPNANSTGSPSSIVATGSPVVALNDVTLLGSSLPTGSTCLFIASSTQDFIPNPGASAGNLCLGGSIGRYAGPGQILGSGASGTVSLAIDLGAIPSPTGFVSAAAGDEWNFQLWHRDLDPSGVPTSNFSDGYRVQFQ